MLWNSSMDAVRIRKYVYFVDCTHNEDGVFSRKCIGFPTFNSLTKDI